MATPTATKRKYAVPPRASHVAIERHTTPTSDVMTVVKVEDRQGATLVLTTVSTKAPMIISLSSDASLIEIVGDGAVLFGYLTDRGVEWRASDESLIEVIGDGAVLFGYSTDRGVERRATVDPNTEEPARESNPHYRQYDEKRLRRIVEQARESGDEERADLAHMLLWAQLFVEQAEDAVKSLAREVLRFLDDSRAVDLDAVAPLRAMLAESLDGECLQPIISVSEDGPWLEVRNQHWAVVYIAESLGKTVAPAPNFAQMRVVCPGDGGEFIVTVQRPGGKSPAELVAEAKAEVAQTRAQTRDALTLAQAEIERLRAECEDRRQHSLEEDLDE